MSTIQVTRQQIHQTIDALPEEGVAELAVFVELLQEMFEHGADETRRVFAPVDLPEGILCGYEFSPDLIAETRRVMWPEPR